MNYRRGTGWCALFLATACNAEPLARESEALSAGATSAESAFAQAGQAALSDEELDRLLDALEEQLQTQQNPRR